MMLNNLFTDKFIEQIPVGCSYQKLIFDNSGNAYDFKILKSNKEFENIIGVNSSVFNSKNAKEALPWLNDKKFDWIQFFLTALKENTTKEVERYVADIKKLLKIKFVPIDDSHFIIYWEQIQNTTTNVDLELIPIPVFKMNNNREYTFVNKAFEKFIEVPASKIIGKTVFDIEDKKNAELYNKYDLEILDPKSNVKEQKIEYTFTSKKGEEKHAIMYKNALFEESNVPCGIIGYIINITEDKLVANYMQEQKRISKNIKEFSTGLASIPISQNIFRFITHNIKSITNASLVSIATYQKNTDEFEYQYSTLQDNTLKSSTREINRKFKGVKFYSKQEINFYLNSGDLFNVKEIPKLFSDKDVINNELFAESFFGEKLLSILPLHFEGNLTGIIIIAFNKKPPHYSNEELEALAGMCSNAIRRWITETSLLEGEMQYRRLIDSMQQGLALHEIIYGKNNDVIDYKFLKTNEAYEKHTGLKKESIIGKTILEVFPSTSKELFNKYKDVVITGVPNRFEHYSSEASKHYEVVAYRPGPNLFAIILTDITERKKTDELREKIQITKRSVEFKQNFLANMSHEIRTPLTGIVGMLDILAKTKLDPKQFDYINTIRFSSETLRKIIDQILDYSKIEAGKEVVKPKIFESKELLDNAQKLFESICKKDIKFYINKSPFLPDYLETDIQMIFQILNNLLYNAVKFTNEGSITINILPETWIDKKNLFVRIEVIDTGIGIRNESKKHLFKPFSQLDNMDIRRFEGTGLGLSICKNLANLLGGHINVESEPEKGSKFWFTFKASLAKKPNKQTKEKKIKREKPKSALRVLHVEDKEINRKVVRLMLESLGCKVESAENGEDAIKIYADNTFDIILMDIQMPVMDGITATKNLKKKHSILPPIIGLSANAFEGDREKYIKMGMDEYLTKPFKAEDLVNLLKNLNLK